MNKRTSGNVWRILQEVSPLDFMCRTSNSFFLLFCSNRLKFMVAL